MSLDRTQPWQAITFRGDPQEYAFTHAVFVRPEGDRFIINAGNNTALCEKSLPDPMIADLEAFGQFCNTNWLSCPKCQLLVNRVKSRQ